MKYCPPPSCNSTAPADTNTLSLHDALPIYTDIGAINSAEQLSRITTLVEQGEAEGAERWSPACEIPSSGYWFAGRGPALGDRKSTRLNSSHVSISYAVFCLKKKNH